VRGFAVPYDAIDESQGRSMHAKTSCRVADELSFWHGPVKINALSSRCALLCAESLLEVAPMMQSDSTSSPPVTRSRPRRRTLEMLTRGAPAATVTKIEHVSLALLIVALASPEIQACVAHGPDCAQWRARV
jgi:hypothetical protein